MEPRVLIGKTVIHVEVAKDTETIRTGLSGRDTLASDRGILFVFPRPKWYRFWMRNMRFSIDMIWIRGDKIVGVTENIKNEFDPAHPHFYKAPEKVDHVLEVNAGFAKRKNICAGDTVVFNNIRPQFEIVRMNDTDKEQWNQFVERNQSIVGTFLGTWEWGDFQKKLGLHIERYAVKEGVNIAAMFTLIRYKLPFGLYYGYMPRGPVIAKEYVDAEMKYFEILQAIQEWAKKELSKFIFLRMEPPLLSLSRDFEMYGLRTPLYTIQPPHNTVVPLTITEEEILKNFHPSTRSNIKRAERRSVICEMEKEFGEEGYRHFFSMIKSTIARGHGKNAYPSETYLRTFLSYNHILNKNKPYDPARVSIGVFCGYHDGIPAATHIVVFFGDTATYLFGASYTEHLNSKVDTYLHFAAMKEAKRLGMRYYDLGGIDEDVWPSLTRFKRQFGGDEIYYVGNVDVPLKPPLYHTYNILKKMLKKSRGQL
ncbi:MAG TPA: peptidoglycan bridge formation glycyltransferase FemA/FemB family protein [Candidatus Paceibacterota bacterium]|nr:peptidoglycan bridge formation glycyltransferase FemA/FemB family protein [Candidatus Paceibacterota bacterium]